MTHGSHSSEFRHEALFYASQDEFLERTSAFLREGVEAEEPALVVLRPDSLAALKSELNGHADRVLFADMGEVGSNPARIIPAWREFVDRHSTPGRGIRGIGEPIWAERSPAELVECQRHESLLNLAFEDTRDFFLLCPYDTSALDPSVIEEAHRSHPFVAVDGIQADSTRYRDREETAAPFAAPLPDPRTETRCQVFQTGTLRALREFVTRCATDAGFSRSSTQDIVLAVGEVATNSIVHGGGGGILRVWQEDGGLICEVNDTGRIEDPLVGRMRPEPGQIGGHGLWLANQVCELVQVRTYPGGNAVRLHLRRR